MPSPLRALLWEAQGLSFALLTAPAAAHLNGYRCSAGLVQPMGVEPSPRQPQEAITRVGEALLAAASALEPIATGAVQQRSQVRPPRGWRVLIPSPAVLCLPSPAPWRPRPDGP